MIPSGPPNPGGAHNVNPVLLRSNSGILVQGSQGGNLPSQTQFSSMVSTHNQFGNGVNMGLLGNMANMSSLLNQTFSNGGQLSGVGLSADHINLQQHGGSGNTMDIVAAADSAHLSYNSSGQGRVQNFSNPSMGQIMPENPQAQQGDAPSNFQQQFSAAHSQQQLRNVINNIATVKSEPQMGAHDRNGPQQQLPSFRNLGAVKLEPQQLQSLRSLASVKLEPQQDSDSSMFLQQQQQQQQLLQMSRQPSPSAMQISLMQQQQQQQQLLKTMPQQRPQLPQQLQQQALSLRPQVKTYEPGTCARRLTHYMYNQRHRPADNNIEFWRKFVNEYFAPRAKKRWCVSLYGSGRQTTGVFPQDVWHCEICNRKPGRGFETTVEVLPRLCKIKYDSGTLEELLYVDMPREYQNSSGQIVLDYAKAIQESVFEQLRVVRDGHLRIVFNSDLKICSWEFCARRHEELIPRRLIVPQVSQLGAVAEKYQSASQNAAANSSLPAQELQNTCNSFVVRARQMARALEVPLVNDLGYTKRYVRCLQISEVVNSMKDLIDYSRETGAGPMASLANFPRRTSASSSLHGPASQQPNQQQPNEQAANQNDPNVSQISTVQLTSCNGVASVNSALNAACSSTSSSTIAGLLHQNSMNSRHENTVGNMNNSSGSGNTCQIPSAGSSSSLTPQNQVNPSSPFTCHTPPASSNNPPLTSQSTSLANTVNSTGNISSMQQSTGPANVVDQFHSQASMQQIMHKMMISCQIPGVGSYGNETKVINGITPTLNGGNHFMGNGIAGNPIVMGGQGFGNLGGMGNAATASGIRAAMINNAMALGGRGGLGQMALDPSSLNSLQQQQQQEFGNSLINNGLGRANSFNNIQFDWKTTP